MTIGSAAEATDARPADLYTDRVAKAYGRWAPVYDLVFGRVFAQGRSAAIRGRARRRAGA